MLKYFEIKFLLDSTCSKNCNGFLGARTHASVIGLHEASGEPGLNPIAHPPFGPVREGEVRRNTGTGGRGEKKHRPETQAHTNTRKYLS